MRRGTFQGGILWRLIIPLVLALCLVLISSNPAVALSMEDYFSYSYDVEFSKVGVKGGEVFSGTVEAEATCTNDLPLPASEALITGRIIAEHQASGAKVTLNSSYTVIVNPFPSQKGQTTQVRQVVPLQFPRGSQPGAYSVVAELIEAKVKAILWIPVTAFLPSSLTVGSVRYVSGGGGGGGGVPAPPAPGLPPGTCDVSGFVGADGIFTETVVVESEDGNCSLTIDKGAIGLTKDGAPLSEISILVMEEAPAPPENASIIGLTYDLGPDGATFNPPITLTFTYDESLIPEGVAEENLVMAIWDEATGEWVVLAGCTVDPETNTITAPVSHFTAFTILAYTPPAGFVASALSISPTEVDIGEEVIIKILVTNSGDVTSTYKAILKMNGAVEATKEIAVPGGASREVTFTTFGEAAGIYTVNVNGLSGTFKVRVAPPPPPTPMIPPLTAPINWWLIGGIIAASVIIGIGIWLVVSRRRV